MVVEVPTVRVPCTHVLSLNVMRPAGEACPEPVERLGLASMMMLDPVRLRP